MKKIFFLVVSILFLLNNNVKAESLCDYKEQAEINGKASNIKASYEIKEETVDYEEGPVIKKIFLVTILNMDDEFYLVVKNNQNNNEVTYKYKDSKNGIIEFEWENFDEVTNFTIEIHSSSKTSCPDERFRTIYLTLPRYNEYSRRSVCEGYEDFYLCQEFVTFSKVNEETFLKQIDNHRNSIEEDTDENDSNVKNEGFNLISFINDYKWVFVGVVVFVVLLVITIIKVKNKKQRDFK